MDELGQRSRAHLAQLLSRFPTEDVVSLSITPGLAEETLPLSRDFLGLQGHLSQGGELHSRVHYGKTKQNEKNAWLPDLKPNPNKHYILISRYMILTFLS